jgi:hypothetical protein
MAKYKISEGNLDKFLSFFGIKKNDRPQNIDDIISSDPKLAKIDKELGNINREAAEIIKRSPQLKKMFKDAGLDY